MFQKGRHREHTEEVFVFSQLQHESLDKLLDFKAELYTWISATSINFLKQPFPQVTKNNIPKELQIHHAIIFVYLITNFLSAEASNWDFHTGIH